MSSSFILLAIMIVLRVIFSPGLELYSLRPRYLNIGVSTLTCAATMEATEGRQPGPSLASRGYQPT